MGGHSIAPLPGGDLHGEGARKLRLGESLVLLRALRLMMRRNDGAFQLAVNRSLAELYRSGDIAPIYERWFGPFGKPSQGLQAMCRLNGLPE